MKSCLLPRNTSPQNTSISTQQNLVMRIVQVGELTPWLAGGSVCRAVYLCWRPLEWRRKVAPLLIWGWKENREPLFSPLSVSFVPLIPVIGSPSRTNPSNSADDHLEGKELVSLMIKFNQPFKNIWMCFSWAEQCNGLEMRQRMGRGRRRRAGGGDRERWKDDRG